MMVHLHRNYSPWLFHDGVLNHKETSALTGFYIIATFIMKELIIQRRILDIVRPKKFSIYIIDLWQGPKYADYPLINASKSFNARFGHIYWRKTFICRTWEHLKKYFFKLLEYHLTVQDFCRNSRCKVVVKKAAL